MRKRQRDDVASGGKRLPPRLRPRYSWVETVGVELLESMDSSMSTTVPQPDEFEFPAPSGALAAEYNAAHDEEEAESGREAHMRS